MKNSLIIERLISCRQNLSISKQEAAKRMLMSQPAYLRYESGERTPSIQVIYFMANVLGTSVEYLTGKTDDPAPTGYWIHRDEEPELFTLIETYHSTDENLKKRMTAYAEKLKE